MDLNFTPEEIAFRDEARHFFRTAVPDSIRAKVAEGEGLTRDDMITSQRILKRARLGNGELAGRVGRAGLDADPDLPLPGRDAAGERAGADRLQRFYGRPGDRPVRQPGNQGAVSAGHRQRRHLLVPGLLRTRIRVRPGLVAHQGRTGRRQICDQRAEDLDHAGAIRRLDFLPVPHRPVRQGAGGDLLHPGRHEDPPASPSVRSSPSTGATR